MSRAETRPLGCLERCQWVEITRRTVRCKLRYAQHSDWIDEPAKNGTWEGKSRQLAPNCISRNLSLRSPFSISVFSSKQHKRQRPQFRAFLLSPSTPPSCLSFSLRLLDHHICHSAGNVRLGVGPVTQRFPHSTSLSLGNSNHFPYATDVCVLGNQENRPRSARETRPLQHKELGAEFADEDAVVEGVPIAAGPLH